ncbi:MAG: molecular chaperone [Burkholderiales bacterium]
MSSVPAAGCGQLNAEDDARAGFYALIGRLFYDAPDAELLAKICDTIESAPEATEDTPLLLAWRELQNACKNVPAEAIRQEYESLFIGVGKALVTPYTARYASGAAADKHLVSLRQQLGAWGLGRRDQVFEVEDHIAGLCDVMRYLIENNQPLADQRQFFARFVYPTAIPFLEAVNAVDSASFYAQAALLARAFFELEHVTLEMEE